MGKHAYLILAHKNPGQLRKLLELLDDERNDIFVHVDKKARFNPDELLGVCKAASLKFAEERISVHWGGVSIIRCELNLLDIATRTSEYDYYHLLSGMDLPIKPQDEIHGFFDRHAGKEFLNCWKWPEIMSKRVNYYTLFPEGERFFLTHFINDMFIKLQRAVGYSRNRDVDFHYASQWFSITDGLARYVLSQREWIRKVFSHAAICDEIFLATVVWNSPYRDNIHVKEETDSKAVNMSNMRFIDWTRGKSIRHPWTFRTGDMELLMSVPHFWARKFDETVDPQIIDRIYSHLKSGRQ